MNTDLFQFLAWLNRCELARRLANPDMSRELPASEQQTQQHEKTDKSEDDLGNPLSGLGQVGKNERENPPEHSQNHTQNQERDQQSHFDLH